MSFLQRVVWKQLHCFPYGCIWAAYALLLTSPQTAMGEAAWPFCSSTSPAASLPITALIITVHIFQPCCFPVFSPLR